MTHQPLFVDTAALFARFNERATEHERARTVFRGIRSGGLDYGPLFTSRYVLSELGTLLLRKVGHRAATTALSTVREATSFNLLRVTDDLFDQTCTQFRQYDDQQISFVDHTSGVLAEAHDVDHVFTFDRDDFQTLGFTVVPADTDDG